MYTCVFSFDIGMNDTKYFPLTRLIDYDCYYPYGNTPPQDLLQSITADVSEPEVLLLGCGDMRSCFYTLWNNFDPRHSHHFKGVHFVLNDTSAAVLARNIISLYLCTKMPSDKDDVVKWVASFWSIWFCHELLPQHKQVLMDALSQLLEWSKSIESWTEKTNNPLRKMVHFITPATLAEVHKIWQMWYSDDRPVEMIRTSRWGLIKETKSEEYHRHIEIHLVRCFGTFKYHTLSPADIKCIEDEMERHHEKGIAFAEEVFGLPVGESSITNSTFYERLDGTYTAHNGYPFRCFSHAFRFSPEYVKKFGYSVVVNGGSFLDHPLLANSIQQFSIWVLSCAAIFSKPHHILFLFHHSDGLDFCQSLSNKVFTSSTSIPRSFDAIHTSNVIDFVALPSLVLVAMLVLRQTGLLFTTAFRYIMISDSSRGYLYSLFGCDSKYLPLLYGIRCIGYDDEYSAELSVKPVSMAAEADVLQCVIEKSLVWQHVISLPLKQITSKDRETILNTLGESVKHMLTSFMSGTKTTVVESLLCTETVIRLLQSFVSQLDSSEYDYTDYKLWSPLCSLLLSQNCLRPFLMSLQTQSLLHGLHLHLTVSELNCPLCNKKPISKFIRQYSVAVHYHGYINEPRVSILIHKSGPVDAAKVFKILSSMQSTCVDNVHVISSIAKQNIHGKTRYEFLIPASLAKKDRHLTIISSSFEGEVRMAHKRLSDCKITVISYSFNQLVKCRCNLGDLDFGTVLQHSGNTSCFESVVSLSEQSMHTLEHHQMTTSLLTTSKVRVIIGKLSMEIPYPYPIDYGKVSIKLSRKNKRITVVAYRKCHQLYEEEQPVYIVNPDNALALPTMPISELHHMPSYSGYQYSFKDTASMRESGSRSLEVNAKISLATILQQCGKHFFLLAYYGEPESLDQVYTKCQCFIVVENRKYDPLNKTAAVDMWFCFLTPEKCENIFQQWCAVIETEGMSQNAIFVDAEESQFLQKIFNYFATRTACTSKKPPGKRYQLLVKHKIDHHFTRAVVYPLYPSHNMMGLGKMGLPKSFDKLTDTVWEHLCAAKCKGSPVTLDELEESILRSLHGANYKDPCLNKCSLCGNCSENLMRCSCCRSAQYCNRECQKKHWSIHKTVCHPQGQ